MPNSDLVMVVNMDAFSYNNDVYSLFLSILNWPTWTKRYTLKIKSWIKILHRRIFYKTWKMKNWWFWKQTQKNWMVSGMHHSYSTPNSFAEPFRLDMGTQITLIRYKIAANYNSIFMSVFFLPQNRLCC